MAQMATLLQAIVGTAYAFGFEFNGAQWTIVVRRDETVGLYPRVDVFEDGEAVGIGYLSTEDGPMFDASHLTPLGGKSIYTADGDEIPMDGGNASDRWAEILHYQWKLASPKVVTGR